MSETIFNYYLMYNMNIIYYIIFDTLALMLKPINTVESTKNLSINIGSCFGVLIFSLLLTKYITISNIVFIEIKLKYTI